jgi:hypothetical protein
LNWCGKGTSQDCYQNGLPRKDTALGKFLNVIPSKSKAKTPVSKTVMEAAMRLKPTHLL